MRDHALLLRGLNIHYRVEGHGPDVVLLHGWVSSRRMWAYYSARLAPTHQCWSLDLPGCGDSDKPAPGWYSIPNYTALLHDFLREVGLRRAHVVGHSLGGMIALDFAATHPKAVERLIAINPLVTGKARPRHLAHLNWDHSRPLVDLTLRLSPKVFGRMLGYSFTHRLPAGVHHFRRRTEDFFKGTTDSVLGSGRAAVTYNLAPKLGRILAPTLIILGSRDMLVPNSEGRLAAEHIPGARLALVRAGHVVTDDAPERTLQLFKEFLA
jgi:pimeloyl-ACP methyl ester carboxylesterase